MTSLPGKAAAAGGAERVARAAGIMAIAAVASRFLGILREATVAALFGAGDLKGAYVVAYYVPFFVQRLLLGGTLSIVFIPAITKYLAAGDEEETRRVVSNLFTVVLLLGALMVVAGQLAAPWIVPAAAPGFADRPGLMATTVELTRIIFVAMLFLALSVLLTGYLQAHQKFTVPAFAPVLFNLTIIGGTLWLGPTWGIRGLAIAWVVGTAAQFAVQIPAAVRQGFRFRLALDLRHPALAETGRLAGPAMLGLAVIEINAYVGRFFASLLPSAGRVNAVAVLDYAYEVIQAPIGFFAISIATAVFPLMARHVQERDRRALVETFSQGLRATIFITLPVMAVFLAVPELFVRVLFERFAFTPDATRAVAAGLAGYGAGIVPIACYYVVTRAYYALHDMVTPVRVGVAMIVLNAALVYGLMGIWGHVGIALAASIVTTTNVVTLAVLLRRRVGDLDGRRILTLALRGSVAAAAAGGAAWGVARWFGDAATPISLAAQLAQVGAAGAAAAAIYLGACRVLAIEELGMVMSLLRRRSAKRAG